MMLLEQSSLYVEHTKVPGKRRGRRRTFLHGLREGREREREGLRYTGERRGEKGERGWKREGGGRRREGRGKEEGRKKVRMG